MVGKEWEKGSIEEKRKMKRRGKKVEEEGRGKEKEERLRRKSPGK